MGSLNAFSPLKHNNNGAAEGEILALSFPKPKEVHVLASSRGTADVRGTGIYFGPPGTLKNSG
jgi:hypothetical protein